MCLLLLLLLPIATLAYIVDNSGEIFNTKDEYVIRHWRTNIWAQYSTKTDTIVGAFRHPPFSGIRHFKLVLSGKYSQVAYPKANETNLTAKWQNVTVIEWPLNFRHLEGQFNLHVKLTRFVNGTRIHPVVQPSSMLESCVVSIRSDKSDPWPSGTQDIECDDALPTPVTEWLWSRHQLRMRQNSVGDCCLSEMSEAKPDVIVVIATVVVVALIFLVLACGIVATIFRSLRRPRQELWVQGDYAMLRVSCVDIVSKRPLTVRQNCEIE